MASKTPKTLTHSDYTVAWICALSIEQTAAIAMLDEEHADLPQPPSDPNAYSLGSLSKHNIVIACLPKGRIGNSSSATVITQLINTFRNIKISLLVGIGGGMPPEVRLGDVVVSSPTHVYPGVVQWDLGKAEQEGGFRRIGALDNPPTALLTALGKLESKHELHGSSIQQYLKEVSIKHENLSEDYTCSDGLEDILFRPEYSHRESEDIQDRTSTKKRKHRDTAGKEEPACRYCDRAMEIKRPARHRQIHYGLIASGNQVIKDAGVRDRINRRLDGHVRCFEMEAAGLMTSFPCVVIRGICG